jgi:hypothetical protein
MVLALLRKMFGNGKKEAAVVPVSSVMVLCLSRVE